MKRLNFAKVSRRTPNAAGEMTSPLIGQEREAAEKMREALRLLLDEVIAAGFESAKDYNWPQAIADAKAALGDKTLDKTRMSVEEACRAILRPVVADRVIAKMGLRWAIVTAMAAARTTDDPEAIEVIRQASRFEAA